MHHVHHKFVEGKYIVLVGNPNVGKSAIFNQISTKKVSVSNYPGTTVEIFTSEIKGLKDYVLVDTPGIYNLFKVGSEDERVTRDVLLNLNIDTIVLVIDSKDIERGLFLLFQLLELDSNIIVSLNMFDEASRRGININEKKLEEIFGIRFIKTIAIEGYGISNIINEIGNFREKKFRIKYPEDVEHVIEEVEACLKISRNRRFVAICSLLDFENIKNYLKNVTSEKCLKRIEEISKRKDLSTMIYNTIRLNVEKILKQVIGKEKIRSKSFLERMDEYLLHPIYIIPSIILILILLYYFVGVFGAGVLVDFLEGKVFGEYINPFLENLFKNVENEYIRDLFVGEYGIFTLAITYAFSIILPIVTTFFIAFSILEDSGYLPRLASYLHFLFKKIGLSGKAVIPTILGFGCVTMATITTRTLETSKERKILSYILALAIPCSAQQAVILAMVIGLGIKVLILWFLIIFVVYTLFGMLLNKIIKTKETGIFIYDLPPLRIPKISNVLLKTYLRLKWYITEVVPLFILASIIIFVLDKLNILELIYKFMSPIVVNLLNLPKEAAIAFVLGFLRRDYGAAGFFHLYERGLLNTDQIIVSIITITFFVPCIANLLVLIRERGIIFATISFISIISIAFIIGSIINMLLKVI